MQTRHIIIGGVILVFISFILYTMYSPSSSQRSSAPPRSDLKVPQISYQDELFISDDNQPPALNSWFSSTYFKQGSEPVFVTPQAVQFTQEGFAFNLPRITSNSDTVFGSFGPEVRVDIGSNVTTTVASYDERKGSFSLSQQDQELLQVDLIRGTPVIYVSPVQEVNITIQASQITDTGDGYWQIDNNYGLYADQIRVDSQDTGSLDLTVNPESIIRFIVLPENVEWNPDLISLIRPEVIATKVNADKDSSTHKTKVEYQTTDNQAILLGSLQEVPQKEPQLIYQTLKGPLFVYAAQDIMIESSLVDIRTDIQANSFTAEQQEVLRNSLAQDIQDPQYPEDTYFGGKALARMAYLIEIADAFGWEEERDIALQSIIPELTKWLTVKQSPFEPYNFVYNKDLAILVGKESSFGSELGNDHHFHYAYFIYSASVVSEFDDNFYDTHREMVDLIATSFANIDREDSRFSYIRVFDHFDFHSWASGPALFGDGNNQESSSEAVNAWYSLYRWAQASENAPLAEKADWLHTHEINSAQKYWLNTDYLTETDYQHPLVSNLWGGKVDYATWFSDRDEAKFIIQFLPMGLNAHYLRDDRDQVQKHIDYLDSSLPDGYQDYQDYLLMYESIVRPKEAYQSFQDLSDESIDDGNSRTAGLLWIFESINKR